MIGVIEHEKIGELLLVQLARHVVQREQAGWHRGEGEKLRAAMPHHDIEPEMVASKRQSAPVRLPNRDCEGPAQQRPNLIAELFPGGQHYARVRPNRRLLRRDANLRKHVVAIVEPQIRRHERAASALQRLIVETILGGHAHEHMDKRDRVAHHDVGSVRTVTSERVGDPIELVPAHRPPVEAQ